MFSATGCVKTDLQKQMGWDRLKASLRISEGVPAAKQCPNAEINLWFDTKVRQSNYSNQSYHKQQKAISSSLKDVTVITELTMSVIEADKEEPKDKISK